MPSLSKMGHGETDSEQSDSETSVHEPASPASSYSSSPSSQGSESPASASPASVKSYMGSDNNTQSPNVRTGTPESRASNSPKSHSNSNEPLSPLITELHYEPESPPGFPEQYDQQSGSPLDNSSQNNIKGQSPFRSDFGPMSPVSDKSSLPSSPQSRHSEISERGGSPVRVNRRLSSTTPLEDDASIINSNEEFSDQEDETETAISEKLHSVDMRRSSRSSVSAEDEALSPRKIENNTGNEKPVPIRMAFNKDDLSDVSDIESNEDFGSSDKEEADKNESREGDRAADNRIEDTVELSVEKEDQLDFEEEEDGEAKEERKDGLENGDAKKKEKKKKEREEELEEGEVTSDEDDNDGVEEPKKEGELEPKPICRFFNRGQCTWGSDCRFIHPGVSDKGNYSMFEPMRSSRAASGGSQGPHSLMYAPVYPPPVPPTHPLADRLGIPPVVPPKKEETPAESAWERGLRQAKEMIKKSAKLKETDEDFEDKKMNLTLGQEEVDRENDYYTRHSSPVVRSPLRSDKWKSEHDGKQHGNDLLSLHENSSLGSASGFFPPLPHSLHRPDYWAAHRLAGLPPYDELALRAAQLPPYPSDYYAAASRRYLPPSAYYAAARATGGLPPVSSSAQMDYFDRKQKASRPYRTPPREVIVQKMERPYREESSPSRYKSSSPRQERIVRADEWADPWMRSKSPAMGRDRRRKRYSSKSSYSSTSGSSRSSRSASYSSSSRSRSSRSRSRSRSSSSSRSGSQKRPPAQFKLSPSSRMQLPTSKRGPRAQSPVILAEKRPLPERGMPVHRISPTRQAAGKIRGGISPPARHYTQGVPPAKKQLSPVHAIVPGQRERMSKQQPQLSRNRNVAAGSHSKMANRSSSSTGSSSSSSSTEESSGSSSSSGEESSPGARNSKRVPANQYSAKMMPPPKTKSVDVLKMAGQKQQIKLTLKGSSGSMNKMPASSNCIPPSRKESKKRPAPPSSAEEGNSDSDLDLKHGGKSSMKRGPPSRREELLKQLKAVEDAIARKRSKIG